MKKTDRTSPKASIKNIKNSPAAITENKYVLWGMFIVFTLCVFSISAHKLEDDDFFWHLSTGKFISENGFIPDKDVFGFATQNAEWIPFEWGFDIIFYNLHKIAGLNGIFIFTSALFCFFFFFFIRLLQKLKVNSVITVLLLFILLIAIFDRLSPRPHLFTYLFLAALVYLLFTYKYINRQKYFDRLYFIPLLFLLWGNLHLGALTGLLLLALFIISEALSFFYPHKSGSKDVPVITRNQLKRFILIFISSAAVLLVNPYGIRTYTYAYSHSKMKMLEQIAEWVSPFNGQIESTFVLTIYKILLFTGLIVLLYSYKKRDFTFSLICLVFAVYSLQAIRFIVDYEIVIIPMLAISLNYFLLNKNSGKTPAMLSRILNGNAIKAALIIVLLYLAVQFQSDSFYITLQYNREAGLGVSNRYFPQGLYKFMLENKIKGTPFNNFDTGGYYKWLFPDQKIFIDSRNINDELFNEYYSILKMQPGFRDKLDKYGIDIVIFFEPKLSRYPEIMKQQVTEFLLNNKDWALIYWDDLSMLFARNTPQNAELISKFEYKVFNPYTAVFNQKQFEANLGNYPIALDTEMKRKAATEPQGYFYSGMSDIVRKVMNNRK